jgi:hypothetical protein
MRPSVLVVAHPGHEARIFGWYERMRPYLFLLTKGDRNDNSARLEFARELADRTGAIAGSLFGCYSDREIYNAILERDPTLFVSWTMKLIEALVALDPSLVVTDSWQLYNVSHDLVHVMTRVATGRAAVRLGHTIDVLDFAVVPDTLAAALPTGREVFRIELDKIALARKTSISKEYPGLNEEVTAVLAVEGSEVQQIEIFRAPVRFDMLSPSPNTVPPYERYGQERVAAGVYKECIRWNHVHPIVDALRNLEW